MKNNQMPPVIVPARPSPPPVRQGGTDPFSRPASEVTVEEWRILICSVAGRLRLSQGFGKNVNVPATGNPILLAQNDKSYALFVSAQSLGVAFSFSIGGDPRSATAQSGIEVNGSFEQILLPKEKLYATSSAGGVLVVTEVTV